MSWRAGYLTLVVVTSAVYAGLVFVAGPQIAAGSNGGLPFDLHVMGYSPDQARAFLSALSDEARAVYGGLAMVLDSLFPGLFALVLGLGTWRLLRRQTLTLRLGAMALAGGYALFDYLENAAVRRMLAADPATLPDQLVETASRFTVLKFFFVEAALTVVVVLLVARAVRWFWANADEDDRVFTVAIDGPAAAGKGTISKAVAEAFDLSHLDTGLLYRAVGMLALDAGGLDEVRATNAAHGLSPEDLERDDLRGAVAADAASQVAAMPKVRAALVRFQKGFARRPGGTVLDGRDIGTVICPEAEVKIYVTASPEKRAQRRHAELVARGAETDYETVLAEVRARDARDAGREAAPMKPAADAVLLDTSDLDVETAVARAIEIVAARLGSGRVVRPAG
jgi:cytidylate kinase